MMLLLFGSAGAPGYGKLQSGQVYCWFDAHVLKAMLHIDEGTFIVGYATFSITVL